MYDNLNIFEKEITNYVIISKVRHILLYNSQISRSDYNNEIKFGPTLAQ